MQTSRTEAPPGMLRRSDDYSPQMRREISGRERGALRLCTTGKRGIKGPHQILPAFDVRMEEA
jgi:hypothetical protein